MFYSLLLSRNLSIVVDLRHCLKPTRCDREKKLKEFFFFFIFFFLSGMGTKIEYSINLLATLVDRNNLAVGGVDVWEHYQGKHQRSGINKLQGPMDRMLDRNNIESIKKTMQVHEDVFKHQVSSTCGMIELFILTNTKFMFPLTLLENHRHRVNQVY